MYMLNVPWNEAGVAGGLFGTKVVLNEFVAFIDLAAVQGTLSPVTVAIVTFALCGFANFSSIAIQMAVTGGLAPNQRPMIAKLGLKALLAGSLSNLMSAALAGLILAATATAASTAPPPRRRLRRRLRLPRRRPPRCRPRPRPRRPRSSAIEAHAGRHWIRAAKALNSRP